MHDIHACAHIMHACISCMHAYHARMHSMHALHAMHAMHAMHSTHSMHSMYVRMLCFHFYLPLLFFLLTSKSRFSRCSRTGLSLPPSRRSRREQKRIPIRMHNLRPLLNLAPPNMGREMLTERTVADRWAFKDE